VAVLCGERVGVVFGEGAGAAAGSGYTCLMRKGAFGHGVRPGWARYRWQLCLLFLASDDGGRWLVGARAN
jgi:hypothetical protein